VKSILSISALALTVTALTTFPMTPAKAESLSDAQKAEMRKLFDEYIMESGDKILDSVNKFQRAELEAQQAVQNEKAAAAMEGLKKNKALPFTGNKDGDVTIVEFFDYNCGYCRKALEAVEEVLADDKKIKVVFIDMPILGPASRVASEYSLAATLQGDDKYFPFHRAIMNHNGPKDAATLKKLAKQNGLDVEKLEKDAKGDVVAKQIADNLALAREIGIQGTPGFIVGEEVVRGFIQSDQMKRKIDEIRSPKKEDKE